MGYYGDKLDECTSITEARGVMAEAEAALARATREAESTRHDMGQLAGKLRLASGYRGTTEVGMVAMIEQLHMWRRAGQTVQRLAMNAQGAGDEMISTRDVLTAIALPDEDELEEASDGGQGPAEGGRLAAAAG